MSDKLSILIGGDFSVSNCEVSSTSLWDETLFPIVSKADFRLINLEGALTFSEKKRPKIGVALKGKPTFASYLKQNKVDMVSLANNHIFDYEEEGVLETQRLCDEQHILHGGILNRSQDDTLPVTFVNVKGKRIGFYCLAEHEFNYKDDFSMSTVLLEPARNVLEIQAARKQCDALIVFSHIGPEHVAYPSPRMVALFHCFAEAGASAVVNAHAHHVMGMENYRGVPIFYGLGNLLFTMNSTMPGWTEGMMVRLDWQTDNCFSGLPIFTRFSREPMSISLDDTPKRLQEFVRISEVIKDAKELDAHWHEFCCSQRKHILSEALKGILAMLPYTLKLKLMGKSSRPPEATSYFAKGARMLRGMFQCENHADVLARIFRDYSK